MKKLGILSVYLLVALVVFSQKATIYFEEKEYNFGVINEDGGKVTHVFDFTNKGTSPLVVRKVQTSCGCTSPSWTKSPVEQGKNGTITVTYNPIGRPGPFAKTITVYNNSADEQIVLTIKGQVTPKDNEENNTYPIVMGGISLKGKVIQLNNIYKGDKQVRTLDIQNSSKTPIRLSFENLPGYITAVVSPEIMKPNEEAKITFSFNSKFCTQWGPISDEIYVVLNGKKIFSDEYTLLVTGNLIEDFGKMTFDQKRKAPILEMPTKQLELGKIKPGAKRVGKFKVTNKGDNALEIRRIINSNKELTVRHGKTTILGGKSSEISVELNTKNLMEGEYKKSITIQSNDPDNSFFILVLNWTVQK